MSRIRTAGLIAFAAVLNWGTTAGAADWPDFRGPRRSGISPESEWHRDWTVRRPSVLWRVQVGIGSSSCAVVGNRLYTMGANRDGREAVICLDASTGSEIWRSESDCPFEERLFEGGPASTPVWNDGRIYTLGSTGDLTCRNAEDGQAFWQRNLERDFKGVRPKWGWVASPLVIGNMVLVETGGNGTSVVALNRLTGSLLWRRGADPAGCVSPVVFSDTALRGVALLNASGLVGIDPRTGAELFRHPWRTPFGIRAAQPVHAQGNFLLSGGGQGSAVVKIADGKPEEVREDRNLVQSFHQGVLFDGDYYVVNEFEDRAVLECIEFSTGVRRWTRDLGDSGPGNVTLAGGMLIVTTVSGDVVLAEASRSGYREAGRVRAVDGPVRAAPAFSDARLFLRNNRGTLVALNLRNDG